MQKAASLTRLVYIVWLTKFVKGFRCARVKKGRMGLALTVRSFGGLEMAEVTLISFFPNLAPPTAVQGWEKKISELACGAIELQSGVRSGRARTGRRAETSPFRCVDGRVVLGGVERCWCAFGLRGFRSDRVLRRFLSS